MLLFATSALFLQPASAQQSTSGVCPADHYDETVVVRSVHDGDTLRLKDGRKIRLIGINTPELARENKPAQAFATEARNRLKLQISKHNNIVKLVYGKERQDHYKRTLAHLFLPDGQNLQADLLAQGLATANTYPPNDFFSDCYHRVETTVRCKGNGIWSEQNYTVKNSADLGEKAEGFHILSSHVQRISASDKATHLFLEGGVLIGINVSDMRYFDKNWLKSLVNQPITVRGWLHSKKQARKGIKFYMRLRHPSAINLPTGKNNTQNCRAAR